MNTTFKTALLANMREAIQEQRADGTISMSVECFRQNVRTPSPHMEGAPNGTNARYYYCELFADLVRTNADVRAFARS